MWLALTLLTGVLITAEELTKRSTLRGQSKDTWAFSLFYSLIGTIITFPFMLTSLRVPRSLSAWLLVVLIGILIVANNWLFFKASGRLEASVLGSVMKLRLVWIFILGLLVLHEPFEIGKLAGTSLTILAGLAIVKGFKGPQSAEGITLALLTTVFNAGVIILAKYLIGPFSALSLTFFAFFLTPLVMNFVIIPNALDRIRKLSRNGLRGVIITCVLGAGVNLAMIGALALNSATSTVVITEAFLVLILVGEHVFLKEKDYVWVKLTSVVLAVAGAVLIQANS